ncbi:uncharacterized protein LOC117173074 [Belonocnema kinseyi]|uniref:uncharacterized protein LOC117173074 n=1 Tax=Belonocnema kinseyi TaxID=2817044 RepID=UPI00143E09EE|nr:uncharacterized protein LOC117173074 [Belonocnema kinseyi]
MYISNIWAHTHLQVPTALYPTDFGWNENKGKFHFKWFQGDQLPSALEDITIDDDQKLLQMDINCSVAKAIMKKAMHPKKAKSNKVVDILFYYLRTMGFNRTKELEPMRDLITMNELEKWNEIE